MVKKCSTFQVSRDKMPKYTVKEVADMLDISSHTIRYYDNIGLIPSIDRTDGNIRMFSDYTISWLKLVHCLRTTGLPIEDVRHYIQMCQKGDSTIPERAELIFKQEKSLRAQIKNLKKQMEILKYKKSYYKNLLDNNLQDICNPQNYNNHEPNLIPDNESEIEK